MNKKLVTIVELVIVLALVPFVYKTWKNFFVGYNELKATEASQPLKLQDETPSTPTDPVAPTPAGGLFGLFSNENGTLDLKGDKSYTLTYTDCNGNAINYSGTYTLEETKLTLSATNAEGNPVELTYNYTADDLNKVEAADENICYVNKTFTKDNQPAPEPPADNAPVPVDVPTNDTQSEPVAPVDAPVEPTIAAE